MPETIITIPENRDDELWVIEDCARRIESLSEDAQMRATCYLYNRFGILRGPTLYAEKCP